jgi:ketosteroid isomerase-like protein
MELAVMTNTMLVQESYGHFKKGNIPALLENLSDDVQWLSPGPKEATPWAGRYTGKKEVAEFFKIVDKEIEFLKFEPREFVEQGNRVIALGSMEGKSKRTGKVSASDWVMAFTVKNGKVTHFQEYVDTYAAYKAFSNN